MSIPAIGPVPGLGVEGVAGLSAAARTPAATAAGAPTAPFSLDVAVLWERGAHGFAMTYVVASVAGAILALFAGLWLARTFA